MHNIHTLCIYLYDWYFMSYCGIFPLHSDTKYSIMVEGNQSDWGNPQPSVGCWQTFPRTAEEEASLSSDRTGEGFIGHGTVLAP